MENPSRPTVVVTGATGRIGQMLQKAWNGAYGANHHVIWSARDLPNNRSGEWLSWDIGRETATLPSRCIVLHLAAVLRGTTEDLAQNAVFARNVLQSAIQAKARHILFGSSIAVLGPSSIPLAETHAPDPVSDYAKAKLAAELVFCSGNLPCPVSILRIANVIGADALLAAIDKERPVTLDPVPNQPGGPIRTWIGPFTLARTLSQLISLADIGGTLPILLNVACQPPIPMADILDAVGQEWRYGNPNPKVNARSIVLTDMLSLLVDMPHVSAQSLIAEWKALTSGFAA